jgi:hypothetical protein
MQMKKKINGRVKGKAKEGRKEIKERQNLRN